MLKIIASSMLGLPAGAYFAPLLTIWNPLPSFCKLIFWWPFFALHIFKRPLAAFCSPLIFFVCQSSLCRVFYAPNIFLFVDHRSAEFYTFNLWMNIQCSTYPSYLVPPRAAPPKTAPPAVQGLHGLMVPYWHTHVCYCSLITNLSRYFDLTTWRVH